MFRSLAALFALSLVSPLQAEKPKQAAPTPPPVGMKLEPAALKVFKARSIGPAAMGGRISDLAFDPKSSSTFYVASAHGGLFKTSDGGGSFQAVTDDAGLGSIGAVAVAPGDGKTIWVGTGEANDRNSSGWGKGVFRSRDAGATWEAAGLKQSKCIARIVVDPRNPDVAYAAAMGDLWKAGGERGLYKTSDGGATWKAILRASGPEADKVGCGDVLIDPGQPDRIYAALYARIRRPWSFQTGPDATGGRDLGGIFRSDDGGATWTRLEKGLPRLCARIGLAASASKPGVIMAVVESLEGGSRGISDNLSKTGGVFRSEDSGSTWTRQNPLNPRPFYFSQIRIAPDDDQRIYLLGFVLHTSSDGGKTWQEDPASGIHADLHALAFDPRQPQRLILGTDGGLYHSWNKGKSWEFFDRLAIGEYYRVSTDDASPYRIGGGLQDNRNWIGPSRGPTRDGIFSAHWTLLGGGDGFHVIFDPEDPDLVYAESQEGSIFRLNLKSGARKSLRPEAGEGQPLHRFHWASPFLASRHQKGVLYLAGDRVFRLTEKGEHWQIISPVLSTPDPARDRAAGSGAESFGVVYTLAESPLKAGLLWAGTDDGRLWRTDNEGGAWTDLTEFLPPQARGQWLYRVAAGSQDPKVAYLAAQAFRGGSAAPLVWCTEDSGRTWRSVAGDLPQEDPVRVIAEHPGQPRVLFAGTEGGLFASFDQGQHWKPFGGLPPAPVDDLAFQARERDLIVATHGRSLYVLDDLGALGECSEEILAKEAHLFTLRPVKAVSLLPSNKDSSGKVGAFRGANPPEGLPITFWLKAFTGEDPSIVISDGQGQTVATLKGSGKPGFQRLVWDLRPSGEGAAPQRGDAARLVKTGEYKVQLTFGKLKQSQTVKVEVPPGLEAR